MGNYKPIQKSLDPARATGAGTSASRPQAIPLGQSVMGNRVFRQALDAKRVSAREEAYTAGCDRVTTADRTPEDAAERLLGGREKRKYGPYLAWINGIEPDDWIPGVTRLCVPPLILEDMAKLAFEEDRRAKEALKNEPANVRGLASVHDARRRQEKADLRARMVGGLLDSDERRRDFLNAQASKSIYESAEAARARINAEVARRIGTAEVFVNAPDRVRGFFVLSDGAATYLSGLLRRGFGSHIILRSLRFHFDASLPASVGAQTEQQGHEDRWIVSVNPDRWDELDLVHRLALMAHEAVHAVQDQAAPAVVLDYRRFAEGSLGNDLLYGLPRGLKQTPLDRFNPVDLHYTLEAIATRIQYEILVNDFHAEPESWQQLGGPM